MNFSQTDNMRVRDRFGGGPIWCLAALITIGCVPTIASAQNAGPPDARSTPSVDTGSEKTDGGTPRDTGGVDGADGRRADLRAGDTGTGLERPLDSETSEAAREDTLPGGTLAVISYMVLWGMILLFAVYLGWRQRALNAEIEHLESRLDDAFEEAADFDSDERTS